jgi:FkbM family methyltransferase
MSYAVVQRGRLYNVTRLIHAASAVTGGRGLSSVYRIFLSREGETDRTIVQLASDSIFAYPALDYYWDYYIKGGRPYEPELFFALSRLKTLKYRFIDGGANFGYWSVMVSSSLLGSKSVVAVEASAPTVAVLKANARLNAQRFHVMHRAIHNRSGEHLSFGGRTHAGRSIGGGTDEVVQTISLDDIAEDVVSWEGALPVVCKLDVEGAEVASVAESRLYHRNAGVFIYEDHGKDISCANTARFLSLGSDVFHLAPSAVVGPLGLDQVRHIKSNRFKGYNFLALPPGENSLRPALIR